jgi:hypothetical protein
MSIAQWIIWIGALAFCYFAGAIWLRDEDRQFRAQHLPGVCPMADLQKRQELWCLALMLLPFGFYLFAPQGEFIGVVVGVQAIYLFERLAALGEQSVHLNDAAVEKCLKVELIIVGLFFSCFFLAVPMHNVITDIAMALSLGVFLGFELTLPEWAQVAELRNARRR